MALRVRLLISVGSLFLSGCLFKASDKTSYNIDSLSVVIDNGTVTQNNIPFTGRLYELNQTGTDTLFIRDYKDGVEDGLHKLWYPDRKISEIRSYTNGKKSGIHTGFWPNGKMKFRYHFDDDLFEGTQYEWYMDGQPFSKKEYKNGHENGLQQTWLMDGKIRSNYEARNGRNYGNIGKKNCFSKI